MKLMPSIRREWILLSRSIYFYVEIAVAVIFLTVLLVVLPETFDARVTEYAFIDLPASPAAAMEEALFAGQAHHTVEDVTLRSRGNEIPARLHTTDLKYVYMVTSRDDLIALAEDTGRVGTVIHGTDERPAYEYYLQGYETGRYLNYIVLASSGDLPLLTGEAERQPVRTLAENSRVLNDRQNLLPLMITVNCVLMGIFATAAQIIEDKKTQVIKALRVLPARIGVYLTAKMAAVILTALVTCLIIAVPVMRGEANYPLLCLTVVCGVFFTVSVGALLAGVFDDMGRAFAAVYVVLIVLLVPAVLGMMPSVDAPWIRLFPSYYALQSVKESLLNGSAGYVLRCCAGFAAGGLVLMPVTARRFTTSGIGG